MPLDAPRPQPPAPPIGLDIETDTAAGGLDPEVAAVVAVAVCSADGRQEFVFDGSEPRMLREVDSLLARLPAGPLVTWNGSSFDLPFLARRAELHGVALGLRVVTDRSRRWPGDPGRRWVRARWHGLVHLDGYLLYRHDVGRALGLSRGLKNLARLAGLAPLELDRERLHLTERAALRAYVASDARCAAALVARRMPHAMGAADFPWPDAPIAHDPAESREADTRDPQATGISSRTAQEAQ